jgi:hypothetical protein
MLTGDLNLDVTRRHNSGYRCKAMLVDLQDAAATAGFEYHITSHTFRSYGMHSDGGPPTHTATQRLTTRIRLGSWHPSRCWLT